MIVRELRRLLAALLALMAWAAFLAVVAGCADERATLWTQGGVRVECPGVIFETAEAGFHCGDLVIPKPLVKDINHFGPRPWWY